MVESIEALQALYPKPSASSAHKSVAELNKKMITKIEQSSLCVIASFGPQGVDCSPRGDAPGKLVKVLDNHTLAIADRPGSNRLDTAKNVITNGKIGAWFLSSEWEESVRVAGNAHISTDVQLIKRFELDQTLPVTVLVIQVTQVAIHNDRAVKFSGLLV